MNKAERQRRIYEGLVDHLQSPCFNNPAWLFGDEHTDEDYSEGEQQKWSEAMDKVKAQLQARAHPGRPRRGAQLRRSTTAPVSPEPTS